MNILRTAIFIVGVLLLSFAIWDVSGLVLQQPPSVPSDPDRDIASPEQIAQAIAAWERSGHASTYDNGLGADTTCARCKSPQNWDPYHPAAERALNCASCKRIPGEPRPVLEGGEPVSEDDWLNIGCPICHEPVGNSYDITPVFWNQELGIYEPVGSNEELCAHCHEGRHGFEVEQEVHADMSHPGWSCLDCHGAHGGEVSCVDCHEVTVGTGAETHADHPEVHCSACHDAGKLGVWRDDEVTSDYYDVVVTRRFAHTLTSWPSHNLQTEVVCQRCHHSGGIEYPALAQTVSCQNAACHPQGAVLNWCPFFERSE
jgi:hypothetical protein